MSDLKDISFNRVSFWVNLVALLLLLVDYGFDLHPNIHNSLYIYFTSALIIGLISVLSRYTKKRNILKSKVLYFDISLAILIIAVLFNSFNLIHIQFIGHREWLYVVIFLIFFREFSSLRIDFKKKYFNPAQLFLLSFISMIILGTLMLMLPHATQSKITILDALFTATSAVCVTGLTVVDTGTYFTGFGQTIIIFLIQLGGLGIMTFTRYFSYFFRGSTSYENQLVMQNLTNSDKIADVFKTLKRILYLTFIIEFIGAVFIYFTLNEKIIQGVGEKTYFSVFHSISSFCNAGFSTLSNSLNEPGYRFNYSLHLTIAALFLIGGIGFPIIFNFIQYIKYRVKNRVMYFLKKEQLIYKPWVLNINTRIVLITSAILMVSGTVLFYIFEYNNTLSEHSGAGKVITAFFAAVTPRTAGLNTIDNSALAIPTVLIIFFLMWVGASPGSTGGGIKTSTLTISIINFINVARGKKRNELFKREIADISIKRASAIITLSIVVIGLTMFFIGIFDSDKEFLPIAFESISAFSTVGLSMGITSDLSNASKMVLIITMFIGRVSMLTILTAMLRKVHIMDYRFPSEEILIN